MPEQDNQNIDCTNYSKLLKGQYIGEFLWGTKGVGTIGFRLQRIQPNYVTHFGIPATRLPEEGKQTVLRYLYIVVSASITRL